MASWKEVNGSVVFGAGGGSETYTPSGKIDVSTTQVATAADTNETQLYAFTIPASTLNANGQILRIRAWGSYGATANNKVMKAYLDDTLVLNQTVATNAQRWEMRVDIIRTGAATEQILAGLLSGQTEAAAALTSGTESLTAAQIFKITGTNGTAAANDIVFRGAYIELLP